MKILINIVTEENEDNTIENQIQEEIKDSDQAEKNLILFFINCNRTGIRRATKILGSKALNFEITGSYVQTELGHGSNVRGIETAAIYDKTTDEFILNIPTLRSIKWWPGALGKVSTHSVILAQLIIDNVEYGVNVFVLQMRDENHLPLQGVNIGDLENKIGDKSNDTGPSKN